VDPGVVVGVAPGAAADPGAAPVAETGVVPGVVFCPEVALDPAAAFGVVAVDVPPENAYWLALEVAEVPNADVTVMFAVPDESDRAYAVIELGLLTQ
jgi:hypothetical protein